MLSDIKKPTLIMGGAGVGKSYLINKYRVHKNTIVLAPTGIAALNIGGQTIHSMLKIDCSFFNNLYNAIELNKPSTIQKGIKSIINKCQYLIIDEISMVRADLLDILHTIFVRVKKVNLPFGGVKTIFVGDPFQLPPIISKKDWYNDSRVWFFQSDVFSSIPDLDVYILEKSYRQNEPEFITMLNKLRLSYTTPDVINYFNQFISEWDDQNIFITALNKESLEINNKKINKIKTKEFKYSANIIGDFPQNIYPNEKELCLKKNARVIITANLLNSNGELEYCNGDTGIITQLDNKNVLVKLDRTKQEVPIKLKQYENYKYEADKLINSKSIGTFEQFPIKLGWAITIHKAQGMTLENVYINNQSIFEYGQLYVALSRCKSTTGIRISNKITPYQIKRPPVDLINWYNNIIQQ